MSIERHCALQVFKFEHFHALINDFITAQTAFCHCTFCASLPVKNALIIVVLAGAPKVFTNKLQRVMNAAARVLSGREVRPRLDAVDV